MNWKVGDRAIVVDSNFSDHIGKIVTVMSGPMTHCPETGREWACGVAHYVDIPTLSRSRSGPAAFHPDHLGPIPDNGLEISSWDAVEKDCNWSPKVTV